MNVVSHQSLERSSSSKCITTFKRRSGVFVTFGSVHIFRYLTRQLLRNDSLTFMFSSNSFLFFSAAGLRCVYCGSDDNRDHGE